MIFGGGFDMAGAVGGKVLEGEYVVEDRVFVGGG